MKRVPIYENKDELVKFYGQLNQTENALQGVVSRFKQTTGHCPNLTEIQSMFDKNGKFSPDLLREAILLRMYPAQEIEIHGVKVDRKKLREIITLPDLSALTETLQFIGNIIPEIGNFFNFFQIDEEREKVRRLNDRIESQADNYKLYAVTNGEMDRLRMAQTCAGVFNQMVKDYCIDPHRLEIPGFVIYDEFGGFHQEIDFVIHSKLK